MGTTEESNEVPAQPPFAPVVPSPDYDTSPVSKIVVNADGEPGEQSPTPGPSNSDIDADHDDDEARYDISSLINLKKEIIYDDDEDEDEDMDDTEVEDNLSDEEHIVTE